MAPTRGQLLAALDAADRAGNEEDARDLAAMLRATPSDDATPTPFEAESGPYVQAGAPEYESEEPSLLRAGARTILRGAREATRAMGLSRFQQPENDAVLAALQEREPADIERLGAAAGPLEFAGGLATPAGPGGLAGPIAGAVARRGLGAAASVAGRVAAPLEQLAGTEWARVLSGGGGRAVQRAVGGPEEFSRLGALARERGAVGALGGAEPTAIAALRREGGEAIESALDVATKEGAGIPADEIASRLYAAAPSLERFASLHPGRRADLDRIVAAVAAEAVDGRVPAEALEALKREVQSLVGNWATQPGDASVKALRQQLSGVLREGAEEAVGQTDALPQFLAGKQAYGDARGLDRLARYGAERTGNTQNWLGGLIGGTATGLGGTIGATLGGPAGAAVGAVVGRASTSPLVRAHAAELGATGARQLEAMLGSSRLAVVLEQAGARGPQALAAAIYTLQQQDPEARELAQGIAAER